MLCLAQKDHAALSIVAAIRVLDAETQQKLVAELQGHVAMLARHKVGQE